MHTSYNICKSSTSLINFNIMVRNIRIKTIQIIKTFTPKQIIQYDYERIFDLISYNQSCRKNNFYL